VNLQADPKKYILHKAISYIAITLKIVPTNTTTAYLNSTKTKETADKWG
jgi:hypothetical protein